MARLQRRIIFFGIIVEMLAIILVIIGLYTRFSGAGNPAGALYIYVGGVVAVGGIIAIFSASRQRVR